MTLRERRMAAGLRQEDVAKKLNISQGAVSKWESGETKPPRKHHKKLTRMYKCTTTELLTSIKETAKKREEKE